VRWRLPPTTARFLHVSVAGGGEGTLTLSRAGGPPAARTRADEAALALGGADALGAFRELKMKRPAGGGGAATELMFGNSGGGEIVLSATWAAAKDTPAASAGAPPLRVTVAALMPLAAAARAPPRCLLLEALGDCVSSRLTSLLSSGNDPPLARRALGRLAGGLASPDWHALLRVQQEICREEEAAASGRGGTAGLVPLGMENGAIADEQISVSSCHDRVSHMRPRLRSASAWTAGNNGHGFGAASDWLQVDLLQPTALAAVAVQGRADHDQWPLELRVEVSLDGDAFDAAATFGEVCSDRSTVATLRLPDGPVHARFVRLLPLRSHNHGRDAPGASALRCEVYTSDGPAAGGGGAGGGGADGGGAAEGYAACMLT
jgi:hypothetical protein